MASILRVNTLTDASSNNSVPMATVNQGTAKSWADFSMASTPSADDSFNLASITDVATGKMGIVVTSVFATVNYAAQGHSNGTTGNTKLAGGNTPISTSLFGLATSSVNKTAPHKISEFYGYDDWNGKIQFINASDIYGNPVGAVVAHSTVCSNYDYDSFNNELVYDLTESDSTKLINGTTGSELDFNSWNVSGSADTFAILIYNVGGFGTYLIAANINDDNEINSRTICIYGEP